MLCSLSAEQHVKLARRDVAKTWKVHARSLEYTDELPASWQRARDAASSILNFVQSLALPPWSVLRRTTPRTAWHCHLE